MKVIDYKALCAMPEGTIFAPLKNSKKRIESVRLRFLKKGRNFMQFYSIQTTLMEVKDITPRIIGEYHVGETLPSKFLVYYEAVKEGELFVVLEVDDVNIIIDNIKGEKK